MLSRTLVPLLLVLTALPCAAQRAGLGSVDFQLVLNDYATVGVVS